MSAAVRNLARVDEIVEEVRAGGGTVEQQLTMLFDKFNHAVRIIDPTVNGAWVGYDANRPQTPTFIIFERPGAAAPVFGGAS